MCALWVVLEKELDRLNGAHQIDEAGALEIAVAPQIGGGRHEDLFDAFRLADEFAAHREKGRDHTTNVRRGHAGSAGFHVVAWLPFAPSFFKLPVAHEMIFSPGATRSGFRRPSPVGPLEEKYETP